MIDAESGIDAHLSSLALLLLLTVVVGDSGPIIDASQSGKLSASVITCTGAAEQ